MKKQTKKIFSALLWVGVILLSACSSDDNGNINDVIPQGEYDNGFFVVNEGQFPNEGTISFISNDLTEVENTVFQNVNEGEDVGATPQSMFFDDDNRAYIIANAGNFITVVDRYTFEKIDRIEGDLDNPRYGVVSNGKAYITNGNEDFLSVVDLEEMEIEFTIDLPTSGEFIKKADNGKLYIQLAAFGVGNQIAVFNPDSEEVEEVLETEEELNSIALSANHIYALSETHIQEFDLSDHSEVSAVPVEYEASVANLTYDNDALYFTSGNEVYEMETTAEEAPEIALFEYESESDFGIFYGFEVHNGRIYIADGGDFASDSFIEVRDMEGELFDSFNVGIGPNGFYFNE